MVYLRSQCRFDQAEKSAAWLKLPPPLSIPAEKADIKMARLDGVNDTNETRKNKSVFFTRPVLMPLFIGLSLLVLQQISGIDAIIFFTVEIFHASGRCRRQIEHR